MLGRGVHLPHAHQADHPHPLRRRAVLTLAVAALLAALALLIAPPHAHGDFVTFAPAGVAGVSNSLTVQITLIKQGKKT